MKEILKQEIQKLKKEMESNCYSTKDWNIPQKNYYCAWTDCYKKPKGEEIIFYVDNEEINMFCVYCWPEYMKEIIIDTIITKTKEMICEAWKEEEKGK